MSTLRRVVVTGLGAVTPLGVGVKRTWQRLINAESGIVSTRPLGEEFAAIPSQVAALVPKGRKSDGAWTATKWVNTTELRQAATFTHYALAASTEALLDAGFSISDQQTESTSNGTPIPPLRTGTCLGTGIGNLDTLYQTSVVYSNSRNNYRKISPLFVPSLLPNLGAGHLSLRFDLRGPNHTVSTACTTGAHSIGDAMRFIQLDDADVMLAGGSESCIHPLAIGGFARSRSLATEWNEDPMRASRPFDRDRAGFVIGEGCGMLVLENLEHARARGARVYAEVLGYGCSADAWHITAPLEDGDGAFRAMRRALEVAGVAPGRVDYVNAHATSTKLGDAAENRAVRRLMVGEEGWESPGEVNVSSTKGAVGHLLGGAGAVEALFCVKAIEEGVMPPTLNLENPGEEFDLNYAPLEAQRRKIDVALTNSFGFGGTNASLVFRRLK